LSKNTVRIMYTLYDVASHVNVEPFKAHIYLMMIEKAVNKAIIQHERIAHEDLSLRKIRKPGPKMKRAITTIFSDIHYYLICWAEVDKLYHTLRKVQPIFKEVSKNYLEDLAEHRKYRNHLEHVDDRIERGVSDLGNLSKGKFTFDGKQLDISDSDLQKLKRFYGELINIACNNFDQPFLKTFYQMPIS